MSAASRRSRVLRSVVAAAMSLGVAALGAAPASAHGGGSDAGPANYRSEITDPGAPGLAWRVIDGDGLVELTNTTDGEVIVLGYQGEPYLRFTPGVGVHRNANSPAAYLNEDRFGDAEVPPTATAAAEPDWVKVSSAHHFETGSVSLLLPLRLVHSHRVDLALVLGPFGEKRYAAWTVMPLDWAYRSARLIKAPSADWLDATPLPDEDLTA